MITLAHEEEWPVRGVLKRSPYCTACRPPTSKDRKCGDSAEFVVGARAFSAELGNSLNATGPASLYTYAHRRACFPSKRSPYISKTLTSCIVRDFLLLKDMWWPAGQEQLFRIADFDST